MLSLAERHLFLRGPLNKYWCRIGVEGAQASASMFSLCGTGVEYLEAFAVRLQRFKGERSRTQM